MLEEEKQDQIKKLERALKIRQSANTKAKEQLELLLTEIGDNEASKKQGTQLKNLKKKIDEQNQAISEKQAELDDLTNSSTTVVEDEEDLAIAVPNTEQASVLVEEDSVVVPETVKSDDEQPEELEPFESWFHQHGMKKIQSGFSIRSTMAHMLGHYNVTTHSVNDLLRDYKKSTPHNVTLLNAYNVVFNK